MRTTAPFGALLVLALGVPSIGGEPPPLQQLEGRLLRVESLVGITDTEIGTFRLESEGSGDLRGTPGTATLTLHEGGTLEVSSGVANEVRRVDLESGRPLRRGGTSCATGTEDGCLPLADCPPTPTGPDPLVSCDVAADVNAFRAINGATFGFSSLDRSVGALTIYNSTLNVLTGRSVPPEQLLTQITLASLFANLLAGETGAYTLAAVGLTGGVPIPHVPLNADPCDGLAADCASPGPPSNSFPAYLGSQLNEVLSAQQQATLGCGELHGTNCEATGITLLQTEAGALLQSQPAFHGPVPGPGDPGPDGRFDTADDVSPLLTNPFLVQPAPSAPRTARCASASRGAWS